jgi:hypothetical protein
MAVFGLGTDTGGNVPSFKEVNLGQYFEDVAQQAWLSNNTITVTTSGSLTINGGTNAVIHNGSSLNLAVPTNGYLATVWPLTETNVVAGGSNTTTLAIAGTPALTQSNTTFQGTLSASNLLTGVYYVPIDGGFSGAQFPGIGAGVFTNLNNNYGPRYPIFDGSGPGYYWAIPAGWQTTTNWIVIASIYNPTNATTTTSDLRIHGSDLYGNAYGNSSAAARSFAPGLNLVTNTWSVPLGTNVTVSVIQWDGSLSAHVWLTQVKILTQ